MESLHRSGEQLPDVAIDNQLTLGDGLGHTTLEALRRGVIQMTLGAVDRALKLASAQSAEPPSLVVTGGLSGIVARHFDQAVERQHMTLDGLRLMALGG